MASYVQIPHSVHNINFLSNLPTDLLFAPSNEIQVNVGSDNVTLNCTLAGYLDDLVIDEHLITWTFNDSVISGPKYNISVTREEVPPYGMCGISFLKITGPTTDDMGHYQCSYSSLSQTIVLSGDQQYMKG